MGNTTRTWKGEKPGEENNHRWYIQEKIDGSQMSFTLGSGSLVLEQNRTEQMGQLSFFNKGTFVSPTNKIFSKAIVMLSQLNEETRGTNKGFNPAYVYHGEAVCSTRHNVVQYDRVPKKYFIIYDIFDSTRQRLLDPSEMDFEACRIGLEVVPRLWWNFDPEMSPYELCHRFIKDIEAGKLLSHLGGRPEGVVLKHHCFVKNGKTVATKLKLVAPEFKEKHAMKQYKERATPDSCVAEVGRAYRVDARFHKAYQHLRDAGKLKGDESDIHKLIEECDHDMERENAREIAAYLWAELGPFIKQASRNGLDVWYRNLIGLPPPLAKLGPTPLPVPVSGFGPASEGGITTVGQEIIKEVRNYLDKNPTDATFGDTTEQKN
jgi:hypothetical protein